MDKDYVKLENSKIKERNRKFITDYLKTLECKDCGIKDSRVLEFDHVRGVKKCEVTILAKLRYSIETILNEIEKCEIVCANCHNIRTYTRLNSYRTKP